MNKRNEHISSIPKAVAFVKSTVSDILFVIPGKANDKNEYKRVEQLIENIKSEFDSAELLTGGSFSKGFLKSLPAFVLESDIFKTLFLIKQFSQKIINYDAVHIFQLDGIRFFRDVLPFIVLSKFFGKKVVFDNRNRSGFDRWHRMNYFFT